MPRVKELRDMEIDEISLVDRPANQHAKVVIAKRATEEDIVPEEIYNEDGELLDAELLEEGDVVFDPCMGSGSTGIACVRTRRRFIGIELDETYFNLSNERINKELNSEHSLQRQNQ